MSRMEDHIKSQPLHVQLDMREELLESIRDFEDRCRRNLAAADPNSREWRLANRNISYMVERAETCRREIARLRRKIEATGAKRETEEEKRARWRRLKLARLRENAETMLSRFMVVTPGFNATFMQHTHDISALHRLNQLDDAEGRIDGLLQAEGIRLVSLDNPARWAEGGEEVDPQKLLALHPDDVSAAIVALREAVEEIKRPPRRSTVVWMPRKDNGWQHPDPERTVYPPRIERLALRHLEDGGARLRGWGSGLDSNLEPVNDLDIDFTYRPDKARYEARLSPADVEEILL